MRKIIVLLMAFCLHIAARGQTGYTYDYWFDNDRSTVQTGSSSTGVWQMEADVSGLSEALHSIHIQVTDEEGVASSPLTRYFVKTLVPATAEGRYWFDDDSENISTATGISGIIDVDVSRLSDGFHILHLMVDGGSGAVSQPVAHPFVKVPQTEGVDHLTCLCMIDDQIYKQEDVPAQGGVVSWQFDVSSLPQGFHRMFVQVVTPSGAATNTYQSFFMRETTRDEFAQMKCVYAIDGAEFYSEAGTLNNGTFHFDLDVSSLSDGLHRITYMLNNGQGVTTKTQTQFFMKIPLGGNGITEYWYWLNEQGDEQAHKVTLQERQDPFSLITLLPVESQPIRSSLFQFRIEEDKPVVYAKNDIHLRFYDASGRFTDATKQFVDERVKQEVTDITLLESGKRQTTAKPAENTIKWYKVEAETGDSLQFKLDRAATLQLFSPSGEEVYSASGAQSTAWGGCHAKENGTFYVAMHDVTATYGNAVSIDYEHIDKYAVLSHYPKEVGVIEGNFYIRLYGNGFEKLTKAQLSDGSNVLTAEIIHVQNTSDATLQFSFADNNYPRGIYKIILEFEEGKEDETLVVDNAIKIAEPVFGDIAVNVVSRPAVAKPYPVTVKIKNTGNVTYQFVPLFIANSINKLESIYLLNFGMESNRTVMDAGIKTFYKVDGLFGEDSCIVVPTVIPVINPYQEVEYKVGFVTGPHAKFNMYAWTETPWNIRSLYKQNALRKELRKAPPRNITCEMDPCDLVSFMPNSGCVCEILWGGVSALANPYGAVNQWRNNQLRNRYGEDYEYLGIDWPYADIPVKTPADIIEQVIRECVGEVIPENIANLQDAIENALEMMRNQNAQHCPPPPPNPIDPYMPGDPNDICGYKSESGSKYIPLDVVNVYYDIEFENDSTIANAAAHHIVVSDTLNANCFDLSTFRPTGVNFGGKKVALDGEQNFLRTIDLRPSVNVIAQVQLKYDAQKGIATWDFLSLDPMTMEPTDDAMQGILPVNYDGTSGIGEVSFDISLKSNLKHREEIPNRAGIRFDQENVIMTPTWTNIIDRIAPVSRMTDIVVKNDSTARVLTDLFDGLSGPWRYDVFVQYGEGSAWWKAAENVPADSIAEVRIYEGINHGFYVVATDSAGNVERKEAIRECTLYNGEVTTTIEETPVNKQHGIRLDGTLLTVSTECGWVQRVNVVNMAGQTVVQKGTMQNGTAIDLSRLPTGAYTVTATGCGEKLSRKILLRTEQ